MDSERWQQAKEIFQAALDRPAGARASFLEQACANDAELRHQVEALLAQHEALGDLTALPAFDAGRPTVLMAEEEYPQAEPDPMIGRAVGAYRIDREIGRGGMGAVYLATRADNAFQRRVAIKVIKRGMDTDHILSRFRHERRILAALDHPNIAHLLDGGATETGQPYFVMEYIEGQPLYAYSDARRLAIRDRLRLFCAVCEAVEYAHEKQIIHRDIKPSNILVTATGRPKLFDFGIAKLLNPELASETSPVTATAMQLMTVEYASPEQVRGLPVTFLSDVYSLGVLFYELLTGRRPYRFRSRLLHEMARVVLEEEPEPPSAAIRRTDNLLLPREDRQADADKLAALRDETPAGLRQQLSGALDRIAMKALLKHTANRYQSVTALREDVENYLTGRPVIAPALSAITGQVTLPIASAPAAPANSIAVLPLKLLQVSPESDTDARFLGVGLTDALITRLSKVRSLVVRPTSSVLRYGEESDPFAAGSELGVQYILDGTVRRSGERIRVSVQLLTVADQSTNWAEVFDERSADVLELEDAISEKVANSLVPYLTSDERRQLHQRGTDKPEAYEAYLRGRYHWNTFTEEGFAKARQAYEEAIAADPNFAQAYAGLADYYNWLGVYGVVPAHESFQNAIRVATRAIEINEELSEAHAALAFALHGDFAWQSAESHHRRALELNPNNAMAYVWYSIQLGTQGDSAAAIEHARRGVELDPLTPFNQHNLGWILYFARRFDDSIAQYQRTVEAHPLYPLGHYGLSWGLRYVGRHEEALRAAQRAGELTNDSLFMLLTKGQALAAAGKRQEAEEMLSQLTALAAERPVPVYHLALIYAHLGDKEKTLAMLEKASAEREAWLVWVGVDPMFDLVRNDPRFLKVFRQTGNPLAGRPDEQDSTGSETRTFAVLPFKVYAVGTSESTDEKFLGLGLTDALITRLSKVRSLVVRPTSSVLRYGEESDPFAAGSELGVQYILDGTLRRAGERIRVSVQLLGVATRATQWAEVFDERSADVLELEDLISERVVGSLVPHLTGEEQQQLAKRSTNDPRAYEAYLRGRFHWNTFTPEGFTRAIALFNLAIELDPNYALAYAGLADYYIFLGIHGWMAITESAVAAKAAAQKALALDDTLAEAYTSLGFAVHSSEYDWRLSERYHRRAIELNPNLSTAHNWYAFLLMTEARFDEALAEVNRALELDPHSLVALHSVAWCYYQSRRFTEAVAVNQQMLASAPQYAWGYFTLSWALRRTGQYQEAIIQAQKGYELSGQNPYYLTSVGVALAEAGQHEEARQTLAQLQELATTQYVSPYMLALIHCYLNDREQALAALEATVALRDAWAVWLDVDPQLDPLRSDPRFARLLDGFRH